MAYNTGAYPLPLYLSVSLNEFIKHSSDDTLPTQYISNLFLSAVLAVPSDLLSKRSFFNSNPSITRIQLAYLSSVARDGTQLLSYTQDSSKSITERALVGGFLGVITAPLDCVVNNCISNRHYFSMKRFPTLMRARFALGVVSCTVFNLTFDTLK